MRTRLLAFLLSFYSVVAVAYEGEPSEQVDAFFKDLASGKHNVAVDNLYSSNPVMQQKIQGLALLKQQLGTVSALYGSYLGGERMKEEQLSDSIVRILHVAKYELHPVVWEFYFYRPRTKWIISQALFVDQFQIVDSKK